jgi:cell cycle checkpoint protein
MDHVFVLYCNRFQICIVLKLHNLLGERVFVNLHLQANEVDSWLLPLIELFVQPKRQIMERHIQRSIVPTIFIFSDVYEGKHKPEDLERLIPNQLLYSLSVQIIPIQPVTKAKMKKCIESIAKAEGLSRLPSDFLEELHLSSGGDLRHAIFALQFQYATKSSGFGSNISITTKRDVKLSSFHALGKLLYAKRIPKSEDFPPSPSSLQSHFDKWDDGRGQLEFVPENVLDQTDMNTGSAISFLSYHSPDFFTDVTELSRAFDHISDAGTFLDRFGLVDGPYPMDYASSLGGRAIADANKHPAPNQFRHFSAPKVFDVMKKNRENEIKMDQLRKRLSVGSRHIGVGENIGSACHFVTDSLPYLKNIIPQGECIQLYSICLPLLEASVTHC